MLCRRSAIRQEIIVSDAGGQIPEILGPDRASLFSRIWSGKVAVLLARNTVVSCSVFVFDIVLLWVLVQYLGMDKLIAVTLAFIIANSIHYAFCRIWIFPGSDRALASGYVWFFVNAGVGLSVTLILFTAFTDLLGMNYLVARVIASVFAGLSAFLLNAVLNFRSV